MMLSDGRPRDDATVNDKTAPQDLTFSWLDGEQRYHMIFELASDAILLSDQNHFILDCNKQTCLLFGHSKEEIIHQKRGDLLVFLGIEPETDSPLSHQVVLHDPDGLEKVIEINSSSFQIGDDLVTMDIFHDITARQEEENALQVHSQQLQSVVSERTSALLNTNQQMIQEIQRRELAEVEIKRRLFELESVAKISEALRRARTIEDMLAILLERTTRVVGADAGIIFLVQENELVVSHTYGSEQVLPGFHHLPDRDLLWSAVESGTAKFYPDTNGSGHRGLLPVIPGGIQSAAAIPLKTIEKTMGMLYLIFYEEKPFKEVDKSVLEAIADIAGNALFRANVLETLEQRVFTRTQELETLYSIASIASRSNDYQSMIDESLAVVYKALDADMVVIHLTNPHNQEELPLRFQHRNPGEQDLALSQSLSTISGWYYRWTIDKNTSLLIPDIRDDSQIAARASTNPALLYPIAFAGVPLPGVRGPAGAISVFSKPFEMFSQETLTLLGAVADQIAVAVENIRLREIAQKSAVIEERQRLARELHDSVSQLLYTQVLYADASQKSFTNGKTDQVSHYLGQIGLAANQALKEMRLLIYELRPAVLETEGLLGALKQRLEFVEQRANIHTTFEGKLEKQLAPEIEEHLYRIAIEALNNSLKHATATTVKVSVMGQTGMIHMEISDDGKGFDIHAVRRGIGLSSMEERTAELGGALEIQSEPGKGTSVKFSLGENSV